MIEAVTYTRNVYCKNYLMLRKDYCL